MRRTSSAAGFSPAIALLSALMLSGCEEPNTYVEPPPPKVSVAQPLVQDVVDYLAEVYPEVLNLPPDPEQVILTREGG